MRQACCATPAAAYAIELLLSFSFAFTSEPAKRGGQREESTEGTASGPSWKWRVRRKERQDGRGKKDHENDHSA